MAHRSVGELFFVTTTRIEFRWPFTCNSTRVRIFPSISLEFFHVSVYNLGIQNCDRWSSGAAMTADLFLLLRQGRMEFPRSLSWDIRFSL